MLISNVIDYYIELGFFKGYLYLFGSFIYTHLTDHVQRLPCRLPFG